MMVRAASKFSSYNSALPTESPENSRMLCLLTCGLSQVFIVSYAMFTNLWFKPCIYCLFGDRFTDNTKDYLETTPPKARRKHFKNYIYVYILVGVGVGVCVFLYTDNTRTNLEAP